MPLKIRQKPPPPPPPPTKAPLTQLPPPLFLKGRTQAPP